MRSVAFKFFEAAPKIGFNFNVLMFQCANVLIGVFLGIIVGLAMRKDVFIQEMD